MGYQSQSKDSRSAYSVSAWILNAGFRKGHRGTSGSSLLLCRPSLCLASWWPLGFKELTLARREGRYCGVLVSRLGLRI